MSEVVQVAHSMKEGGEPKVKLYQEGMEHAKVCLSSRQRPHLCVLNRVTLNRIRIWIRSVHVSFCLKMH